MAPGTGYSIFFVIIIDTSNFEMLESRTVWPIEVEKSGRFYILPLSPGIQTFCYFRNTLNVSSSKNEVTTSKVGIFMSY